MASYLKGRYNFTINKIKEEWDAIPSEKNEAPMAASMAPQTSERICFKYQINECIRP